LIAAFAGYALAKFCFSGREAVFADILGGVLILATVLALPLFLLMSRLQLANTYWTVLLPCLANPFGVYLCRVYSAAAVPDEHAHGRGLPEPGFGHLRLGLAGHGGGPTGRAPGWRQPRHLHRCSARLTGARAPETLRVDVEDHTVAFGARQHHCLSSPVFHRHAERYASHPALAMWHRQRARGPGISLLPGPRRPAARPGCGVEALSAAWARRSRADPTTASSRPARRAAG
jgi:hypothetical protein